MVSSLSSAYTVMVVDDDPSVLATYGRLLRRAGYRTLTQADPCDALQDQKLDGGVDLLLLDHRMPTMDGLTMLAELRRRNAGKEIWLEPGRFIVAESGVILARVTQTKGKGAVRYVGIATGNGTMINSSVYFGTVVEAPIHSVPGYVGAADVV